MNIMGLNYMYKKILDKEFIEYYKDYHKTLFRELNIMLFDVAFLNECILHNNIILDTDIVIAYLFKNNFEHLILKTYRIMFDNGADVLTIDIFIGQIIKNINDNNIKKDLCEKISSSNWKSDEFKLIKNRLKVSLGEFRNKAIAHKLRQEMKDLSVDLNDISKLLDAAIEIFELLSFYPLDFYKHKVTKYSFIAERLTVEEASKKLLDILLFSYRDINHINVEYSSFYEEDDIKKVDSMVNQFNKTKEDEDTCFKLLQNSILDTYTKLKLLQLEDFKIELLKYNNISDSEIADLTYKIKQKYLINAEKNKITEYKLYILNSCIEVIERTTCNNAR